MIFVFVVPLFCTVPITMLASLSRIKRKHVESRLTALMRSDVVNRVIEVDLPRFADKQLERF